MNWNPFHRLAARSRLIKAQDKYRAVRFAWRMACDSKDSRRIHHMTKEFQAAQRELLAAEMVVYPLPPMPRSAAKQGN